MQFAAWTNGHILFVCHKAEAKDVAVKFNAQPAANVRDEASQWRRRKPTEDKDGSSRLTAPVFASQQKDMSSKRQRSTRLSSGSVKKRSYIEEVGSDEESAGALSSSEEENSDSEEEFKPEKKSKKAGGGGGGGGVKASKRDSPSSEDFTEDEDASDEDLVTEDDEVGGVIIDSDEEDTPNRSKLKAEPHQEIIEVLKAPKSKSEYRIYYKQR